MTLKIFKSTGTGKKFTKIFFGENYCFLSEILRRLRIRSRKKFISFGFPGKARVS